ncbi:MAG: riboflavin biosynthesis protein RibF, partial [Verrucomicrobiota bacterium]
MQVVERLSSLPDANRPFHLAVGVFDGVHLGHREVFASAKNAAATHGGSPVIVTFDPHPAQVLRPEAAPPLLMTAEQKLRRITALGFPQILVLPFDQRLRQKSAREFWNDLAGEERLVGSISVGTDWRFGQDRQGDITLLKEMGKTEGFHAFGVPALEWEGKTISSSG